MDKKTMFVGKLDVDIGDVVKYQGREWFIDDILGIHTMKFNDIYFHFVLSDNKELTVATKREHFTVVSRGEDGLQ